MGLGKYCPQVKAVLLSKLDGKSSRKAKKTGARSFGRIVSYSVRARVAVDPCEVLASHSNEASDVKVVKHACLLGGLWRGQPRRRRDGLHRASRGEVGGPSFQ